VANVGWTYSTKFFKTKRKNSLAKTIMHGKTTLRHKLFTQNWFHYPQWKKTLDKKQHNIVLKAFLYGMIFWKPISNHKKTKNGTWCYIWPLISWCLIKWGIKMTCNLLFTQFKQSLMFYFHMFVSW
jgi:hypothetical protein